MRVEKKGRCGKEAELDYDVFSASGMAQKDS